MTLAMTRPWPHPKTGIYWLRKRVPDDLRALVGRQEEKRSLGTKDPAEAKLKHAEALLAVESRWAHLRSGPKQLSEREAHELAVTIHDWWLAEHRENPGEQRFWRTDLFDKLWAPLPRGLNAIADASSGNMRERIKATKLEIWCQEQADTLLARKGLAADEVSRTRLAKAIAAAK